MSRSRFDYISTTTLHAMLLATEGRPWCRMLRRFRLAIEQEITLRETASQSGAFVVVLPEGMH